MKVKIIGACTDFGVDINGTSDGPGEIIKKIDKKNDVILIEKPDNIKETDKNNLKKNLNTVNTFNKKLFNEIVNCINNECFPITIGGDHSIAIGSTLASNYANEKIGVIWVDAHLDYNTFETTISGNLHGLPLAAINGICKELTPFTDKFVNPDNCAIVGYRAKEDNSDLEIANIKKMGVHVFTTNDIKEYGVQNIMNKAIEIAKKNTNGIHVSYDLDFIDPKDAPGVSVPETDGPNLEIAYDVKDIIINNLNLIKSFDLVEYNPHFDIDNKTRNIAVKILNDIVENIEK